MNQLATQQQVVMQPGVFSRATNSVSKSLKVSPTATKVAFGGASLVLCCLITWQLTKKGKRAKWPKWVRIGLGVALASIVGTAMRAVDTISEAPVIVQPQQQLANNANNRIQNRNQLAAQQQLSIPSRTQQQQVNGSAMFQRPQANSRFADIELNPN